MTPRYEDRSHAARLLADRLAPLMTRPCVVAAIPRGGVVVAEPVAERLEARLTVIHVRKLTHPSAPDLAFGALTEDGSVILEREIVTELGLTQDDIDRARDRVARETRRRRALYRECGLERHARGLSVVIVDDGMATGLTLRAAVMSAYRQGAADITLAVPCAACEAVVRLHLEVDGIVCPIVDRDFDAVTRYFADFSVVTDEEVMAILAYTRSMRRVRAVGV